MSLPFNGLCMVPGRSWHVKMEMEHWARYLAVLPLATGCRVLDVACGEGYGADVLADRARHVVGVDVSEINVRHARRKYGARNLNLTFVASDASKGLPLADGSMDLAVSFETIEHLDASEPFLRETKRVLAFGGAAILSTPLPNLDPATKKPRNPHHVREFEAHEFTELLGRHFRFVALAGQAATIPGELHDEFDPAHDQYLIGLASDDARALDVAKNALQPRRVFLLKQELYAVHRAHEEHKPFAPRILLVPLADVACVNPADRRRIGLVQRELRRRGFETAVLTKEQAVDLGGHFVLTQDRDFAFWIHHAPQLRAQGKQILFTCSDLLAQDSISQVHSYDSYLHKGLPNDTGALRHQLAGFLAQCAHVFVGSQAQAEHFQRIGGDRCPEFSVDGDPIDTETYRCDEAVAQSESSAFRIIWEGFVDNVPYLAVCADAIRELSREMKVTMVIASARERRTPFMGTCDNRELANRLLGADIVEFHEWSPSTIASLMRSAHAGVAPAFLDDPFSAAKPPNKAIILNYMRLPVVASATSAYSQYVVDGVNGFVARDEAQWIHALRTLAHNPSLAQTMGQRGRTMAASFEPGAVVDRMVTVFGRLRQR
ncbi:MAG: methyltransferase domain-containing protein [Bryobacteraceae bacterium]|jgi:SAM-dependent methyltransferase